jgi:hypothetical protein
MNIRFGLHFLPCKEILEQLGLKQYPQERWLHASGAKADFKAT